MQRYTMVFITINALHVSGCSSAHHQEIKTVYTASGICQAFLLLTVIMGGLGTTHDSGKKQKKGRQIPSAVYTVLSSDDEQSKA
jgi:hypothetical protein